MTQHHYTEFAEARVFLPAPDDADDQQHWSSSDAPSAARGFETAPDLFDEMEIG